MAHKSISIGSKRIDTPAKAVEIGKITRYDQVVERARGVNEIYAEFDASKIQDARRGLNKSLPKNITDALREAQDGEINVIILKYTGTNELRRGDLRWVVEQLDTHSDLVVVPVMPKLARAAADDERDEDAIDTRSFENLRRNVEKFLEEADKHGVEHPLMGTLPVQLPWECNRDLFRTYRGEDIRAFCANFDRRTVTATRQVEEFLQPFLGSIQAEGLTDQVLTYAVNVGRKRNHDSKASPTAQDFITMAHGFDILGENHEGMRAPPSVIEEIQEQVQTEPTTFDTFDTEEYVYHETTLSDIDRHFPSDTALDLDRIRQRLRQKDEPPYRLRALLNAEQMSLATEELRAAIQRGESRAFLRSKNGIGANEADTLESVRDAFEA
jgi:hypothetical protein